MSQRSIRVNELVKREISDILHTVYKDESVYITITGVDVSPDLRMAHIFYSVLGDQAKQANARRFLEKNKKLLRNQVGKKIVLKYLPQFKFVHDKGMERGTHIIDLLDQLDQEQSKDVQTGDNI